MDRGELSRWPCGRCSGLTALTHAASRWKHLCGRRPCGFARQAGIRRTQKAALLGSTQLEDFTVPWRAVRTRHIDNKDTVDSRSSSAATLSTSCSLIVPSHR